MKHAHALDRPLLHPMHEDRLRQPSRFQDHRRQVNDVMELRTHFAFRFDSVGPVDNRAVPGATPMGRDLLGPLVRCVHGVRPAHRIVVVGSWRAKLIYAGNHELGRLQGRHAVEGAHFVKRPVDRSFSRRAVVADDVIDQCIVEDFEIGERIDEPPQVIVHVFEHAGVNFHLSRQHGLERVRHVVPGGDFFMTLAELRVRRHHAQGFLPRQRLFAEFVPSLVELALILVRPFLRHVVWCMTCTRSKIRQGLSGVSAFCCRIQLIARSVKSTVR
jgi:hypothetical protein